MADFPGRAGSTPVILLETVGSTNAEALRRAAQGEAAPFWIVAREQTAGRGRRGRVWASPPGNLYSTLLLPDAAPAGDVAGICFVAAVALHDAVLDGAPGVAPRGLTLKWPNDLLLGGKKLAGILVEGSSDRVGSSVVAVGIGVNCQHHPAGADYPATDLAAEGAAVTPGALLGFLGTRIEQRIAEWDRGRNFAAIREAWLARADGIGRAIQVRLPTRTLHGTFEALDASGALLLRGKSGELESVAAGDVFPQAAPTSAEARPA